jgi:hypothetical protein
VFQKGEKPAAHPVGTFVPIEHVNDLHIVELGRWAVAQHDKQANSKLTFNSVVSGEQQAVAGMRCHLVIDASNPNGRYKADLAEGLTGARTLSSFTG